MRNLVAVVTGANRGIGRAIVEELCASQQALTLYAVSRSGNPVNVPKRQPSVALEFAKMALTDLASIKALASRVKSEQGACDVLINNAGIYYYDESIPWPKQKETLDVNYRGTLAICQEFIPIMNEAGRIVNVSSNSSLLKYYPKSIQQRFKDPKNTLASVAEIVSEYEHDVQAGQARAKGWPGMTYFVSKAAENAVTKVLARENPGLFINCCCPGWVDTDLGGQAGRPPKTVAQGAQIPIRLGFKDISGISGQYWSNETNRVGGEGEVAVW